MGDFNDFLFASEKRGSRLMNMMWYLEFKQHLDDLCLMDIGVIGPLYT